MSGADDGTGWSYNIMPSNTSRDVLQSVPMTANKSSFHEKPKEKQFISLGWIFKSNAKQNYFD
jgi:hypothetical protein